MPLVGLIERGAVDRIVHSVSFARGDVLLLLSQDDASGHLLFEKGQIVAARLGELEGEAAVAALRQWSRGHYSLIKRSHLDEGRRAHVALGLLERRLQRPLERWLKDQRYQTSVIADPRQAIETIVYLQPDLLLLGCPRPSLGMTCAALTERLTREMQLPPAIVVLEEATGGCREPSPPCVRSSAHVERLAEAMAIDWSGTRLGERLGLQEETAKIARPQPRPGPPGAPSEEVLALAVEQSLEQGRLGWRDWVAALAVLLVGSGAIWMAFWR